MVSKSKTLSITLPEVKVQRLQQEADVNLRGNKSMLIEKALDFYWANKKKA